MKEIWKTFEEGCQVSNLGRVRSWHRHNKQWVVLQLRHYQDGYVYALLCRNGDRRERLVYSIKQGKSWRWLRA